MTPSSSAFSTSSARAGSSLVAAPVDDVHLVGAQPQRGARRVHGHVAAAEDRDSRRPLQRRVVGGEAEAAHQIAAGQVLVGRVDAVEVLAGDLEEPGQPGAGADEDGVERPRSRAQSTVRVLPTTIVEPQLDAQALHVLDLAPHDRLGQPELGDAVGQHAARLVQGLEHRDLRSRAGRGRAATVMPAGPEPTTATFLPLRGGRRGRSTAALRRLPVGDEALEPADRHRLALLAEHADASRTAPPAGRRGRRRPAARWSP